MHYEKEDIISVGNRELKVLVQLSGKPYTELYGQDADGNRGILRTYVDDIEVTILDQRNNDITNKLILRHNYVIENIIEQYMEHLLYERR